MNQNGFFCSKIDGKDMVLNLENKRLRKVYIQEKYPYKHRYAQLKKMFEKQLRKHS